MDSTSDFFVHFNYDILWVYFSQDRFIHDSAQLATALPVLLQLVTSLIVQMIVRIFQLNSSEKCGRSVIIFKLLGNLQTCETFIEKTLLTIDEHICFLA